MTAAIKKRPKPLASNNKPAPKTLAPKTPKAPAVHTPSSLGFGAVLYGPPGVGKTSFVGHLPDVGFIIDPQEQGIRFLVDSGLCPAPSFIEEPDSYNATLDEIDKAASRGIKNLALDSATGFEKLTFTHHCNENFDGDWSKEGFYSYQQGPKNAAKTDWPAFLGYLAEVCKAGINVYFLAHSQVKEYTNPIGPNYDRFIPYLDKETWAQTHRWAQAVLFYNYYTILEEDGSNKKKKRKPDMEVEARNIYTSYSPAWPECKNQLGLPPIIDGGTSGKGAAKNYLQVLKR